MQLNVLNDLAKAKALDGKKTVALLGCKREWLSMTADCFQRCILCGRGSDDRQLDKVKPT